MEAVKQYFTPQRVWWGGWYEIEIELGAPSDERLARALENIWSHSSLEGSYLHSWQEPHTQTMVNPREYAEEGRHLYGIARLPNGERVCCGTYVIRLEDDDDTSASDLLEFYVPFASLNSAYQLRVYPLSDVRQAQAWGEELNGWLVELGSFVYSRVKFELALIGFEVDFTTTTAEKIRESGIPIDRCNGYLWPASGHLEWYPPTKWEGLITTGG